MIYWRDKFINFTSSKNLDYFFVTFVTLILRIEVLIHRFEYF
jgi:hypothetical protein